MPTFDPTRAAFVQKPLRFEISSDTAIRTNYGAGARAIEIETNLATTDGAGALATRIFDQQKVPAMSFDVTIEGVTAASLDTFADKPPRFTPDLARFATTGNAMLPTRVTIDFASMTTTLTVRG